MPSSRHCLAREGWTLDSPKAVTQRYFITNLKEISEPVEVTVQIKGSGLIRTLGYFIPASETALMERVLRAMRSEQK